MLSQYNFPCDKRKNEEEPFPLDERQKVTADERDSVRGDARLGTADAASHHVPYHSELSRGIYWNMSAEHIEQYSLVNRQ